MARTTAHRRPTLAAVPERAPATPNELLQRLDGWLQNAGHDAGSTWRRAIAATLQAAGHQPAQAGVTTAGLATLFGEAATVAHTADIGCCEPDTAEDWQAEALRLRHAVARLGWLADLGASMAGGTPVRGGAEWWLLDAAARDAVVGADAAAA